MPLVLFSKVRPSKSTLGVKINRIFKMLPIFSRYNKMPGQFGDSYINSLSCTYIGRNMDSDLLVRIGPFSGYFHSAIIVFFQPSSTLKARGPKDGYLSFPLVNILAPHPDRLQQFLWLFHRKEYSPHFFLIIFLRRGENFF